MLLQKHCLEDFNIVGEWILLNFEDRNKSNKSTKLNKFFWTTPPPIQSSLDDHVTSLNCMVFPRASWRAPSKEPGTSSCLDGLDHRDYK